MAAKFEEVASILREMDVERLWAEVTDLERRVIVEELLEAVAIYPDHLEVTVSGVPGLNVTLEEVGLTGGWQVSWCRRAEVSGLPPGVEGQAVAACDVEWVALALSDKTVSS